MESCERIRMLGRGSYAVVFLARYCGTGGASSDQLVVVKEVDLRAEQKKDIEACRVEALQEAEVLQSLAHPNITAYRSAFFEGTKLQIVMEYADGGDLQAAIVRRREAARRYQEQEAMGVLVQLAMALQYIHERRILHRDLKSRNVFLTRLGIVKLGDFGIAKVLSSASIAQTRIGTPAYLPPEMCNSEPYSYKADMWCLGVVLYEVLALEVPFHAKTIGQLVLNIRSKEPDPVPATYSQDVAALVAQLLAKDPSLRPSSEDVLALRHVRQRAAVLLAATQGHRLMEASGIGGCATPPGSTTPRADETPECTMLSQDGATPSIKADTEVNLEDFLAGHLIGDGDEDQAECALLRDSIRQALESTFGCEQLLIEIESELRST
eukprot:TRINITY_DN66869_c0_g1_i1.p1 TRINITY_DN66869_c0_g1~~TRINITY_DN66869_c0_g1_i1.p1  ORF type:complete len:397 (-),score=83.05 TRINITY_DN66869_c0_g1_i1:231-1373(-)